MNNKKDKIRKKIKVLDSFNLFYCSKVLFDFEYISYNKFEISTEPEITCVSDCVKVINAIMKRKKHNIFYKEEQ